MSGAVIDPRLNPSRARPSSRMQWRWSDPRLRNIVWQVVIVGGVALIAWVLISQLNENLAARHIATGWAFLHQAAAIPIGESMISYTPSVSTYGRALLVGILNTLRVAVIGVVLTTILGTAVGIMRLSPNWLAARISAIYVEVLRDIPVLLQLLFWYGVMQVFPGPRQALRPVPGVFLSNRGIKLPALQWASAHSWAVVGFLVGVAGVVALSRHAARRQAETGRRPRTWPVSVLLLVGLPVAVWAALGGPFVVEMPVLRGFNFQGGLTVSPEYAALLVGLVVYTSSYIAEIVRSGIEAVPGGQWEAGGALGLHRAQVLRQVVLPQALRVIVPPMTSQYLNLIKNSSLAVAIGYQDIVSIADTTLNQTGQAIEGVGIIMAVYLCFSLSISLIMNWYNARIALVER